MTKVYHTFDNDDCVVQIDLEAIPDEARWLTMDEAEGYSVICWSSSHKPEWMGWGWAQRKDEDKPKEWWPAEVSAITASSGTLPPWSECIIDLEKLRKQVTNYDPSWEENAHYENNSSQVLQEKLKQQALSKLTDEEKEALGIK